MARLTFVLPAAGAEPIGGFRIVYQYANAAAAAGHQVSIVHSAELYKWERCYWLYRRLRQQWKYLAGCDYRPTHWFDLHSTIRTSYVRVVDDSVLPDADVLVATGYSTALPVACAYYRKGRGYYLIQGFETFAGPAQAVVASWKLPLRKIVISRWLLELANQFGESAQLIPNGLDFSHFGVDVPLIARKPRIAMLYHPEPRKGYPSAIRALRLVHVRLPEVAAELFGVSRRPRTLPSWVSYSENPSQADLRSIYNRASVFLAPSHSEGWPLPPAEAVACGAAVCATDIAGHREYLQQGTTALLFPAGDFDAMAASLIRLLNDSQERVRLASAGRQHIQQFSLDSASKQFLRALELHQERQE